MIPLLLMEGGGGDGEKEFEYQEFSLQERRMDCGRKKTIQFSLIQYCEWLNNCWTKLLVRTATGRAPLAFTRVVASNGFLLIYNIMYTL